MLHSFVGPDPEAVRAAVREPMKRYLESSVDIVRAAAWSFPAFQSRAGQDPARMEAMLKDGLRRDEMDALLEFAFARYYGTSGLFGTPEDCLVLVERLSAIGIDEIACLIDFGVPTDLVLEHLPHLDRLRRLCSERTSARGGSVPELIEQHAVTHLQGTPSLLRMVVEDPAGPPALSRLRHLLVGGEALPVPLALKLRERVPAMHNMYGPTETTVWSTTWPVPERPDAVSIGRPLRNQHVYVLDACRQSVALGETGELWIGGAGVAAGYWQQPALTAERFVRDPFAGDSAAMMYRTGYLGRPDLTAERLSDDPFLPGARIYRTGDLARHRADGALEFLGRLDHQIKLRGQRLELGEIEAALVQHPAVREAVLVARGQADDMRLCAYVTARDGKGPDDAELRTFLRRRLPEAMVPADFVALRELPLTPNGKLDRKALPPPEAARPARASRAIAAANDLEDAILRVWRSALGTDDVSVEDNFFDVGGHSILAVRVHRELEQQLGRKLPITDLFRFPTVRSHAAHLAAGGTQRSAAQQAAERARARKERLSRGR
jgi:acyl carrier protein